MSSLAWWQIVPHMYHLFGTTCPEDPAWIPGWGRDGSSPWHVDATVLKVPEVWDTVKIPLFPRARVRAVCTEAVKGEFEVPDTVSWRGIRGNIVIQAEDIASGQAMRDSYMRKLILESSQYPQIRVTLDSVAGVTRSSGDTLRGQGLATIYLHGAQKHIVGRFTVWHDAVADGIRIVAKFHFPAGALSEEFHMSKWGLGLGVQSGIWRDVWEGVDLILRPAATSP